MENWDQKLYNKCCWQAAFEDAKAAVLSIDTIEQYYYDDEFQAYLYQLVCDYVEGNRGQFL